jgi:hypothetical protein
VIVPYFEDSAVLIGLICVPIIIVAFIVTLWVLYCRRKKQGVYKQIAIPDGNIFVIDDEQERGDGDGPDLEGLPYLQPTVIDAHLPPSYGSNKGPTARARTQRRPSKNVSNWFSLFSTSRPTVNDDEEEEDSWHPQHHNPSTDSLPVKTIQSSSTLATKLQHLDVEDRSAINIVPKSIPSPQHSARGTGEERGGQNDDEEEEEENRKLSQINRNMLMRSSSKTKIVTTPPALMVGGEGGGEDEETKQSSLSPVKRTSSLRQPVSSEGGAASLSPSSQRPPQQQQQQSGLLSSLWSIFQGKRGSSISLQEMSARPKRNSSPPGSQQPYHHPDLGVDLNDDDEEGQDIFTDQFISPNINQSPVKPTGTATVAGFPPPISPEPSAPPPPSSSLSTPEQMSDTMLTPSDSFTDEIFTTGGQRNSSPSPTSDVSSRVWATMSEKMKAEKRVKGLRAPQSSPGLPEEAEGEIRSSEWFDQVIREGSGHGGTQETQVREDGEEGSENGAY